jgi:hypothetical protein
MYYLIGENQILENNFSLVHSFTPKKTKVTSQTSRIKQAYLDFLRLIQPNVNTSPIPYSDEIQMITDERKVFQLCKEASRDCILTDLSTEMELTPHHARKEAYDRTSEALSELKEKEFQLFTLLNTFVHSLYYQRSQTSAGGTTSSTIGYVWLSIRKNWSNQDIIEFLIHEFAHTLVFLDELTFGHYHSLGEIVNPENWRISAILKRRRPIDKVVHSLIVAHEIILLRKNLFKSDALTLAHPSTQEMESACEETLWSLREKSLDTLVKPRVQELISKVSASLKKNKTLKLAI